MSERKKLRKEIYKREYTEGEFPPIPEFLEETLPFQKENHNVPEFGEAAGKLFEGRGKKISALALTLSLNIFLSAPDFKPRKKEAEKTRVESSTYSL